MRKWPDVLFVATEEYQHKHHNIIDLIGLKRNSEEAESIRVEGWSSEESGKALSRTSRKY